MHVSKCDVLCICELCLLNVQFTLFLYSYVDLIMVYIYNAMMVWVFFHDYGPSEEVEGS